jgi:hypothetical protein
MLVLQILSSYFEMDTLAKLYFIMGEDPEYLYHAGKKIGHKVFSLKHFEKKEGIIDDKHGNSVTFKTCPKTNSIYMSYATIKSSMLINTLPTYFIEHYIEKVKTVRKQNFKCMLTVHDFAPFLLEGNSHNCAVADKGSWVVGL